MNRIGWLLVPALLIAGVAQAQVAVTELVPAAPRFYFSGGLGFTNATVTPDNPAAITWGEPARFAAGRIDLKTKNPAVPGSEANFSGYYAGYRGVTDTFAFGLEHVTTSQDSGGFQDEKLTNGHLAFQALDGLSLGAALEKGEVNNGTVTTKLDSTVLGLSVSLKEKFYIGYAIIDDSYSDSTGVDDSRDGNMIGLALRLEGGWNWLLAYDKIDRADFTGGGPGNGYDATTFTVQAQASEWTFGIQDVTVKGKGAGSGSFDALVYDLAWAPEQGIGVGLRYSDGDQSNAGGGIVQEDKMTAISVLYQF